MGNAGNIQQLIPQATQTEAWKELTGNFSLERTPLYEVQGAIRKAHAEIKLQNNSSVKRIDSFLKYLVKQHVERRTSGNKIGTTTVRRENNKKVEVPHYEYTLENLLSLKKPSRKQFNPPPTTGKQEHSYLVALFSHLKVEHSHPFMEWYKKKK